MDLRIIFGWHLDGPSFPEEIALGKLAVGPIGLIHQLALRLGYSSPFPSQAVRIGKYLAQMQALNDGDRFFSHSFETDSWSTAKALLQMRDDLVAAGWKRPDQTEHADCSDRLRTLNALEPGLDSRTECVSDLYNLIVAALESGANVPIKEIVLVDREAALPPVWRRILRALAANGVAISELRFDSGSGIGAEVGTAGASGAGGARSSDVSRIASALITHSRSCELLGDGTFSIVEADDEVQSADFLASYLSCGQTTDDRLVIIRGNSTSFLDQLLHKANLPRLGGGAQSPYRGYMQLLSIALDMTWRPTNPSRLIDLLSLPHSPIPPYIADCFIRALRGEPGIGGSAWLRAWKIALERKAKVLGRQFAIDDSAIEHSRTDQFTIDQSTIEADLSKSEQLWKQWLEPITFDTAAGMPVSNVVAICDRVRQHSLALYAIHDRDVFAKTAANAQTLSDASESCGLTSFSKAQLDRMLETVLNGGYIADESEASPWMPLDHPGQIYGPAGTVVWWGFINNITRQRPSPWTADELKYLAGQNVLLEHPTASITREAESWRRPFVAPSEQIILLKPRTVAGSPVAAHPFFHELIELVENSEKNVRRRIIHETHSIYERPEVDICQRRLSRRIVKAATFPSVRGKWHISSGMVLSRQESPSSLERLLGCQLNWLMQYWARLKPGKLLTLADSAQMSGNLAHAVFAAVFSVPSNRLADNIEQLAEHCFDDLCPKVAAPLLLPGKSMERLRLRKAVTEGAAHLAMLISNAGFEDVTCEAVQDSAFEDVQLTGRPDMLLRHRDGADYVLDLKLARTSIYRQREIAEGRAVQLAIYSWLGSKDKLDQINAGYYMLAQKQLVCSSPEPFPAYFHVEGSTLRETFNDTLASYRKHLTYMESGTVYATGIDQARSSLSNEELAGNPDAAIAQLALGPVHVGRVSDSESEVAPFQVPGISFIIEPPCKFCEFGRLCGKKEFTR